MNFSFKLVVTFGMFIVLLLNACGGDSSSGVNADGDNQKIEETSSSETLESSNSKVESSSSSKETSILVDAFSSSERLSSSVMSSSSEEPSSYVESSSSSAESSSSVEESSSSVKTAWSFLNPAISYGELVDERDGQVYKTVRIGSRTVMAENLNFAYNYPTEQLDSSSFCFDGDPANCEKYGRLYIWSAAMDSAAVFSSMGEDCGYGWAACEAGKNGTYVQGVCPEGWYIPTKAEASDFVQTLDEYGFGEAGNRLKSTSGWNDDGNGEDIFGFCALPTGYYSTPYDSYRNLGDRTYIWTTSLMGSANAAWTMFFEYNTSMGTLEPQSPQSANSVRCFKK